MFEEISTEYINKTQPIKIIRLFLIETIIYLCISSYCIIKHNTFLIYVNMTLSCIIAFFTIYMYTWNCLKKNSPDASKLKFWRVFDNNKKYTTWIKKEKISYMLTILKKYKQNINIKEIRDYFARYSPKPTKKGGYEGLLSLCISILSWNSIFVNDIVKWVNCNLEGIIILGILVVLVQLLEQFKWSIKRNCVNEEIDTLLSEIIVKNHFNNNRRHRKRTPR